MVAWARLSSAKNDTYMNRVRAFSDSGRGISLVPRCSVIGEKSAWYPLFVHAQTVALHSPYN